MVKSDKKWSEMLKLQLINSSPMVATLSCAIKKKSIKFVLFESKIITFYLIPVQT